MFYFKKMKRSFQFFFNFTDYSFISMKVFFEKFERDTSFEEKLADYEVSDFEVVDEFERDITGVGISEIPELRWRTFVFVDGVMRGELRGGIESSNGIFDFSVFLMCVGAGFESGEMIGVKKKKIFVLHSSSPESTAENLPFLKKLEELGYVVLQVPWESSDDTIMSVMREEEVSVCFFVLEKFPDVLCVIDGNIPWRLASRISGDFPPRIFAVVKNVMWVFEKNLENIRCGGRSPVRVVSHTRKKGVKKFSFFMRVKGNEGDAFRTTDFIKIEFPFFHAKEKILVSAFAESISQRVISWITNVGDRAPWNLTPMRILERKLRAYLGDSRISERKIKREIEEVASVF